METEYLRKCFGNSLAQALAEVAEVRPSDPIEYLANWLYHYRKTARAKEKNKQEEIQLKEEHDSSLKERKMEEMMKEEECEIQQKCQACHKKQIPSPVSTKKVAFVQEDTNAPGKGALEQELLPGAAGAIPGMGPQAPPSVPIGQANQTFETPQEINNLEAFSYEVASEMSPDSTSP